MGDFHHNNGKTRNIYHILFKRNYKSYPRVLFTDEANSHLKSYSTHKWAKDRKNWCKFIIKNYSI